LAYRTEKKSLALFEDVLGLQKMGEWPTYAIFGIGVSFGLEPEAKTEIRLLVDDVDNA